MSQQDASADAGQETCPASVDEVLGRYRELQAEHRASHEALKKRQQIGVIVLAGSAVVIAFQTSAALHGSGSSWPLLVSFAVVMAAVVYLLRLQDPIGRATRLINFYDDSIRRADGSEPYTALSGLDAFPSEARHLYLHDLDILGAKSLFAHLATVRTGIGERGLAQSLLQPASYEETLLRQEAVRELMPRTELRERIALLGVSSFQQLSASFFDQWLDDPAPVIHPLFRWALACTTLLFVGGVMVGVLKLRAWGALVPDLLVILAVQSALALAIRARMKPLLEGGARLQGQVRLFSEGLGLLQRTSFKSERLLDLQRKAREPAGAVKLLKRLDGYLVIVDQRSREYFFVLSLLTAAGSQAGISIAKWKREHVAAMRVWLDAWGEFEALNALATFAFEHPADGTSFSWPVLLPASEQSQFEATALGHPLLPNGVRNDLVFNDGERFLLISGSNMAGKSTLMRSVGVNAILAYAGAPVFAASLRLTPFAIAASISLTDSLTEGKSKFLQEVERLGDIVTTSEKGPVLFLVDEIFSGTNSLDRLTAAGAVLDRLLTNGACGALSTHDLALTTLATAENHGTNVHMASPDEADPLAFDYRLKPGINRQSNAMAILKRIGL